MGTDKDGYDPRAIANLLIEYANRLGLSLSNLSIQKLLYFAHASYLATNETPLVRGSFEAWEYGPVCRTVYDSLKMYGRDAVTEPIARVDPFTGEVHPIDGPTDELVRLHVLNIVKGLGRLPAGKLVDLSHSAGGAWKTVWDQSRQGATLGNRISDKLTKEKFFALKIDIQRPSNHGDSDEATPFAGD